MKFPTVIRALRKAAGLWQYGGWAWKQKQHCAKQELREVL